MQTIDIIENLLKSKSQEAHSYSELAAIPVRARRFAEANIATRLVPLANRHMCDGCTLDVVGNDGPNVAADKYPWAPKLKKWMVERGCTIRYLLLDPSQDALKAFSTLKLETGKGKFSCFVKKKNVNPDAKWANIMDEWSTYHFAIFGHKKQLWIETNHPPKEKKAYGCYYLPPSLAETAGIYEVLKQRFDYVVNHYADLM